MLPISKVEMSERKLILLARYQPEFSRNILIPEIEKNSKPSDFCPQTLIDEFQKNKYAKNSMYFHHSYAYADIPVGQEYDVIAFSKNWRIQRDSVIECKTKVLNFFTAFKTQLIPFASHGHHENSLIQFQEGIPAMIKEIYEIAEMKPMDIGLEICLCSFETLWANYEKYDQSPVS
jgi:hypothetical protein